MRVTHDAGSDGASQAMNQRNSKKSGANKRGTKKRGMKRENRLGQTPRSKTSPAKVGSDQNASNAYTHLRMAFDAVPEGVVLFDPEDRYVLWNRRYEELYSFVGTKIAVGERFEDTLRLGLAAGLYPDALGKEEEWLESRLERHARAINVEEQPLPGDRWIRIEERRTTDGFSIGVRIDITDLKQREASFRMLFDSHPLPMWVWDHETFRYLAVNDAAIAHYGYTREQFMQMTVLDLRPAEDRDVIRQAARQSSGSRRTDLPLRHIKADGTVIDVLVNAQTLPYRGHTATLVVAFDVTERKRAEADLQRTKTFLDTVLDHVPVAIAVKDARDFRFSLVNKKAEKQFGLARAQVIGRTPTDLFGLEVGRKVADQDQRTLASGDLEYVGPPLHGHPNGNEVISSKKLVIRDASGRPEHLLSIMEDITDRVHAIEQSNYMARHDCLTGLANRTYFAEKVNEALERLTQSGSAFSILLLDLDHFKRVNDSLGHPVGDNLLKSVADRLQKCLGPNDVVGRFGGDEFAILQQTEGDQREAAIAFANQIRDLLVIPYELAGHRVIIGTSIGIVLAPTHAVQFDQLMRYADLALYRAKSSGRNQYCIFDSTLEETAHARLILENDLRNAQRQGQFELHYQPVINLATGEPSAAEALLRWSHPTKGVIRPDVFVPLAEDIGVIIELGEWALRTACVDAVAWPQNTKLAVNLSAVQFSQSNLVDMVTYALVDSGLPPERLELEITETILLHKNDENIALLHQLKSIGVSIVLDDFGTGYSSLSYLKMFPWDKVKIDRSFVEELVSREDCRAIVCAVIALGQNLRITTTAEGVETAEQCALLRAAGCALGQGDLFGSPVPKDKLQFIAQHGLEKKQIA
jgi:diguanylate cyclase (GGDEF)-like protein/PAS domain S-box-containing protein